MNAIVNLLKQQIIGCYVLAMHALFFYCILVSYLPLALIAYIISIYIGAFVAYKTYIVSKNGIASLTFSPSGDVKKRFEKLIASCGMKKSNVKLRYSYTNEMVASATFDTICIDPLIWRGMETDEQYNQALAVLNMHIVPNLTPIQISSINNTRLILTEDAQNFIFRHELGHVSNNYTIKKVVINFLIAFSAAFAGIHVAFLFLKYSVIGLAIGFFVFLISDLVFTYVSNATFKLYEEIAADKFAAKYSSVDEINAAADFFKNCQIIRDSNITSSGILSKLPTVVLSGHMNGYKRFEFLTSIAGKK